MILRQFAFAVSLVYFVAVASGQPPAPDNSVASQLAAQSSVIDSTDAYPFEAGERQSLLAALGWPMSADSRYPSATLTGLFQADAGWFDQEPQNTLSVGDVQDGADFRRTRLAAKGDLAENVDYLIEMDFSFPGRPSFMDVYSDIGDLSIGTVRVGQWRQPFGMSALTSVRELPFMERALPFAFVPFRQIGVGLFDHSDAELVTWAVSAFRFPTDQFGNNVGDNGGYGMATRITGLAWYDERRGRVLHAGFNYSFIDPSNNMLRYANVPEAFIGQSDLVPGNVPTPNPSATSFFVDTGLIAAQNTQLFGVELAAAWGSALLQSELMAADVLTTDGERAVLTGGYVQGSWMLTGERHPYNRTGGVFERVTPRIEFRRGDGWGAWEVAGRWSNLDLNDGSIQGGRLNNLTFGMNWYLNKFTKIQFNYIRPMLIDPTLGDSHANIFATRFQVDF